MHFVEDGISQISEYVAKWILARTNEPKMKDDKGNQMNTVETINNDSNISLFLNHMSARTHILKLSVENDYIQVIDYDKGPERRGIAATQCLKMFQPVITFDPLLKIINSFPLDSSNDSCKNTCQECFKVHDSLLEEKSKAKYVRYEVSQELSLEETNNLVELHTNMVTCESCKIHKYCSQGCYDKHWNQIHRLECPLFCRIIECPPFVANLSIPEFIRLGIRLYFLCELNPEYKSRILNLTSHSSNIYTDLEYAWVHEYTSHITKAININMNLKVKSYIWELLCIALVNSSILMNEFQEAIGISFDPDFSLLNHSCIPNTLNIPLDNSKFTLVLTSSINATKELFTNYCFTCCPKELRQLELKKRFYFECKCNLCKNKYDWFFSYNCAECGMLLCGLNFDGFFSEDLSKSLSFKKKIGFCSNCGKEANKEILYESRKYHQLLLATIIHDFHYDGISDVEKDSFINMEEFITKIENFIVEFDLRSYSGEKLLEVISSFNFSSYKAPLYTSINIKTILEIIHRNKIIPSYCFPLNYCTPALDAYDIVSWTGVPKNDKDYHLQCLCVKLKIDLKTYFEVNIPGDLTDLKISTMIYIKDISHQLLTISEVILEYSPNTSFLNDWISDKEELISTLIKCSSFLNLQAIDSYLPLSIMNNNYTMVSNLLSVGKQIKYLIMSKDVERMPEVLVDWYSQSPASFKDEMFASDLKKLFKFADLSIKYKAPTFKLQFADRNRKPIFKPMDQLISKNMDVLQVFD